MGTTAFPVEEDTTTNNDNPFNTNSSPAPDTTGSSTTNAPSPLTSSPSTNGAGSTSTTGAGSSTTEAGSSTPKFVCEDEAGNFCTKNKKKCNKADVQERCPVTCDLCPEELTTTQEPINPTTEVTGSSPTTSSGTTTQEPNNPKPEVCEDEAGNFCTKNKKKCN